MFFILLQFNESVMFFKYNRIVVIINGLEKYVILKVLFFYFFCEVNELISKGIIFVDGQDVELEFFLGGDVKFFLMIMGINFVIVDYFCVWCKVYKDDRWDISKFFSQYNEVF